MQICIFEYLNSATSAFLNNMDLTCQKNYRNAYSLLQCEYLNSNFKPITTSHLLHSLSIQYDN